MNTANSVQTEQVAKSPNSNGIEMGQMNSGYNREPEVAFADGKGGVGATSNGRTTGAGTGPEPAESESEADAPPFAMTLLKVYGWPLLVSQLVMLGYALLTYANPMLLWCADILALLRTYTYMLQDKP